MSVLFSLQFTDTNSAKGPQLIYQTKIMFCIASHRQADESSLQRQQQHNTTQHLVWLVRSSPRTKQHTDCVIHAAYSKVTAISRASEIAGSSSNGPVWFSFISCLLFELFLFFTSSHDNVKRFDAEDLKLFFLSALCWDFAHALGVFVSNAS